MSDTEELINETRHKAIAILSIAGVSKGDIAEKLGITKYQVNKAMGQDEYRTALRDLSDKLVGDAANFWKASMHDLMGEALAVLKTQLKRNNLEAVKIILKSIGVDNQEPTAASSNLTVVLPENLQMKDVKSDIEV